MLDSHRVMKHDNGWQVKRDGGQRASHVVGTKKEAEQIARQISKNQGTELQIHKQNGQSKEEILTAMIHARLEDKSTGLCPVA